MLFFFPSYGVRQPTTGIDISPKYVCECVAGLLARKAGPDNCGDIRMLDPRLDNDRADGVDDDDNIRMDGGN